MHDVAVHDLMDNLDRAFQKPRAIYGDIQPDTELLPSQVTLLRLRRKRQDAAVARYCFHKAVTRYILWWRGQLQRKYRSHYWRMQALAYRNDKCFRALRVGLEQYKTRNENYCRSMGLAIAFRLVKSFTAWRNKEDFNKRAREVNRKFTPTFCAWRRWQKTFRHCLLSSLVGMQAEMTAYDYVLRKKGQMVLNALHVKRPMVEPRKIDKFARLQALKRGFVGIFNRHLEKEYQSQKILVHVRMKKTKIFSQWKSFVKYRVMRNDIKIKEKEVLQRRQSVIAKTGTAEQSCKLGLQNFLYSWKLLLHEKVYYKYNICQAKKHRYERNVRQSILKWQYASHYGCTRQTRALKTAARHVLITKVQQSFSAWRKFVDCQSEETIASGHLQKFTNFKKRESRKLVLDEKKRAKELLAISKSKLDMATALYQFKRVAWARLSFFLISSVELKRRTIRERTLATQFHRRKSEKTSLALWILYYENIKQCKEQNHISDMQHCIVHMRSCMSRWKCVSQLGLSVLRPALERAVFHHLRISGELLFENLLRSGYLKRQQQRARKHWEETRRSAVLATLASVVNTRRNSVLPLINVNPTMLTIFAGFNRQHPTEYLEVQHNIIQCNRGIATNSMYSAGNLMICSRIHEERRKLRTGLGDWKGVVLRRKEERHYEHRVEEAHYFPRLQLCGLQGLSQFVTFCKQVKVQDIKMTQYHGTAQAKCSLQQWRVHLEKMKASKNFLLQLDHKRNDKSTSRIFSKWKKYQLNRVFYKSQKLSSVSVYGRSCAIRLFKRLHKCLEQATSIATAVKARSRYRNTLALRQLYEWAQLQVLDSANIKRGRRQCLQWRWHLLQNRIRQHSENKLHLRESLDTADKNRLTNSLRRTCKYLAAFASRRRSLRNSYEKFVKRRDYYNKNAIFQVFATYKAESDALLQKGKKHRTDVTLGKAFVLVDFHLKRVNFSSHAIRVADVFCRRQYTHSFFVAYITNLKTPACQEKSRILRATSHYLQASKRCLLREWRRSLKAKKVQQKAWLNVVSDFKMSRGLKMFLRNVIKAGKVRKHSSQLIKISLLNLQKKTFAILQSRCKSKRIRVRLEMKGLKHNDIIRMSAVLKWLKRLRQLRHATSSLRLAIRKWHFSRFRQRYLSTVLGRKLIRFTRGVVLKMQRATLRDTLRRWAEHCRLEMLAAKLIAVRTDRLYRSSISKWYRDSKSRQQRLMHAHRCIHTHQVYRQNQIEQQIFFNFAEQVYRSKLQRRLDRKCRRHLFRVFHRRILQTTFNHETVAERNRVADTFYRKSLLGFGLRFLVYKVQVKHHRHHVAFLETRDYHRRHLRQAMKALYQHARSARRRLHAKHALQQHLATNQKRRALQLLDCAVTRRWVQKQQEGAYRQTLTTQMLHRGFHRLLKNGHRCRQCRKAEQ